MIYEIIWIAFIALVVMLLIGVYGIQAENEGLKENITETSQALEECQNTLKEVYGK